MNSSDEKTHRPHLTMNEFFSNREGSSPCATASKFEAVDSWPELRRPFAGDDSVVQALHLKTGRSSVHRVRPIVSKLGSARTRVSFFERSWQSSRFQTILLGLAAIGRPKFGTKMRLGPNEKHVETTTAFGFCQKHLIVAMANCSMPHLLQLQQLVICALGSSLRIPIWFLVAKTRFTVELGRCPILTVPLGDRCIPAWPRAPSSPLFSPHDAEKRRYFPKTHYNKSFPTGSWNFKSSIQARTKSSLHYGCGYNNSGCHSPMSFACADGHFGRPKTGHTAATNNGRFQGRHAHHQVDQVQLKSRYKFVASNTCEVLPWCFLWTKFWWNTGDTGEPVSWVLVGWKQQPPFSPRGNPQWSWWNQWDMASRRIAWDLVAIWSSVVNNLVLRHDQHQIWPKILNILKVRFTNPSVFYLSSFEVAMVSSSASAWHFWPPFWLWPFVQFWACAWPS